jgi:hypothetical protein
VFVSDSDDRRSNRTVAVPSQHDVTALVKAGQRVLAAAPRLEVDGDVTGSRWLWARHPAGHRTAQVHLSAGPAGDLVDWAVTHLGVLLDALERPDQVVVGESQYLALGTVLQTWAPARDSGFAGWDELRRELWIREHEELTELMLDVRARGLQAPVQLGTDWRVRQGHRRLAVAMAVGLPVVPAVLVA